MTGAEIYNALLQRGYSPEHAAALGGHILQESGGDPANVNAKEDAHGLLQWRLDRWKGLQNYALSRGSPPDDPNVQLDYIAREMSGPEAKSGAAFLAARDLPSASAALRGYIRYGDQSDQARLAYGQALLGKGDVQLRRGGEASAAPVGSSTSVGAGSAQPDNAAGQADAGLTQALQAIPKTLAEQQQADTPAPIEIQTPQPMMTPAMIRARQLAAAMLSRSLNPGSQT